MKLTLTKKGLIGNGLLLLAALVSVSATHQMGVLSNQAVNDSISCELRFDTLFLKLNGGTEADVINAPAITMNKHAVTYVKDYIENNKEDLERIKGKSQFYFQVTDAVFAKYGLPLEMKYLAVIESELNTKALSHVGARGAWQLMPETGRQLSLKITKKYDERTHFYKSTV